MVAAMASFLTPSVLALIEDSVVSLSEIRLTICWSVAFDQLAFQPAPMNCGITSLVMKSLIWVAVIVLGSVGGLGKRALKAASKATFAGEPAAP